MKDSYLSEDNGEYRHENRLIIIHPHLRIIRIRCYSFATCRDLAVLCATRCRLRMPSLDWMTEMLGKEATKETMTFYVVIAYHRMERLPELEMTFVRCE